VVAIFGSIVAPGSGDVAAQQFLNQAQQHTEPLPIPDFKPPPAAEEDPQKARAKRVARFNHPIYNPETKSYFEYYFPSPNLLYDPRMQVEWDTADKMAASRVFHGVRGRLAVVKTAQTNKFIVDNFKPEDGTWIGLRYNCELRALRWTTGEFWPLDAYQNWGPVWNRDGGSPRAVVRAGCSSSRPWHGVHYWGPEGEFKWNANGTAKGFGWMIVEYPTGKP
jgi:hypothetical protein